MRLVSRFRGERTRKEQDKELRKQFLSSFITITITAITITRRGLGKGGHWSILSMAVPFGCSRAGQLSIRNGIADVQYRTGRAPSIAVLDLCLSRGDS